MSRTTDDRDLALLRQAIAVSAAAAASGELPFGALIAARDGTILASATSTEISTGDWTCHAETNAVRDASPRIDRRTLAQATIYASAEPCAMCAGAIFYSGICRIVYGFGETKLRQMLATRAETTGLGFSCREVLAHAAAPMDIHGPCLEAEAAAVQARYWNATSR